MPPQTLPGQVIQHFKGGFYKVLHTARDADTGLDVVVYVSLQDGAVYTRNAFRFEETVEWPDGTKRARFIVNQPRKETLMMKRQKQEVSADRHFKAVKPDEGAPEDSPSTTLDILQLVCQEKLPIEAIERWTPEQRIEAERWASAQHLLASDYNSEDLEEIPPEPVHVRKLREQSPKWDWTNDVELKSEVDDIPRDDKMRGTSPAGGDNEEDSVPSL